VPTIAGDRGTRVNRAGTTGDRRGSDRRRRLRARGRLLRGRLLRVRLRCNRPWHGRRWYDRPAGRRKLLPTSARRPPPDSGPARAATGRQVDDRLPVSRPPGGGRHAQRHSSSIRTVVRRSGVTPKQAEQLDKVAGAGQHLLEIINDVLDLTKIESGSVELNVKGFALGDLVHNITNIIGDSTEAKGLVFRTDMTGMPSLLRGDINRLQQALVNYLGNAIKFTARGSITLTGRLLEQSDAGYLVRFEVIDTGIGVPAGVISKLFTPFQQADESSTRIYGGTGLGLVIAKRIAGLMGGEVGVDSTPGQGSRSDPVG